MEQFSFFGSADTADSESSNGLGMLSFTPQDTSQSVSAQGQKVQDKTFAQQTKGLPWTKPESQHLYLLHQMFAQQPKKWKIIAQLQSERFTARTGPQCAQHYKRVLDPRYHKGRWQEHEVTTLLNFVRGRSNIALKTIEQYLQYRSVMQIKDKLLQLNYVIRDGQVI